MFTVFSISSLDLTQTVLESSGVTHSSKSFGQYTSFVLSLKGNFQLTLANIYRVASSLASYISSHCLNAKPWQRIINVALPHFASDVSAFTGSFKTRWSPFGDLKL